MPESANDRFERLAAEFHAATGLMAPGKDQPAELHGAEYNARVIAWRRWNTERAEAMERDAVRYRFLRDNPLGLRAVDGNAAGSPPRADNFDHYVDTAMQETPCST